jgi:3-oxoacyl-[acyl-carrier protein] reductase
MRQVVVTGGGTGIGLAIARAFIAQHAQVTITGRRPDVLKNAAHAIGAVAVAFDASDPMQVEAALPELPETVHVLVNNAGGNTDLAGPDIDEPSLGDVAAAWYANLDANVLSAVLVTTALAPRLAPHARIINVSSIAARGGAGSYGAAKAAVEAWTAGLAAELGSRGVTANAVSPGLILDTEFFRGRLTAEGVATRVAATRNGRAGTPADVAAAVTYLASPEAGHVTGQVLHVNGGAYLGR